MSKVAVIDSGGANIASIRYAFDRLGMRTVLTTDAKIIQAAERVLLPGVGAAKDAMQRLADAGLVDVIRNLTQPVLGICLGMQLLSQASEEEDTECLGIIAGIAKRFPASTDHPVPNMGWCRTQLRQRHELFDDISDDSFFYYLHSYALPVADYTLATAAHAERFSAVVSHNNFFAAQFHPERSATAGAQLLRNFVGFAT